MLTALMVFGNERTALGETALEPVALSYRAPKTCPSFDQFLTEIQRWTARLRLARENEVARHFEVKIADSGLAGQLVLEGGSGGERTVSGANCQAVAELLALAVALAADPEAQPNELPLGVAAFPTLRPARPTSADPKASNAQKVAATPERARALPARSPSHALRWSLAVMGNATGADMPAVTWGGGVFAELALNWVSAAPRFRLDASVTHKTLDAPPGTVKLGTESLGFELCSGALRERALVFLPCLRAQGGTRRATGQDLHDPRSELRGFVDLGVAAHVRMRFAGPIFFELGGALLFPTVRDKVVIRPGAPVYTVPGLGLLGMGAIGVEFGDQTQD